MPGGFSNKPKILRGAFVEYGLSVPPLTVVFQFNPEKLTRNRSVDFGKEALRRFHQKAEYANLIKLQREQITDVKEEVINLEIRLDATDRMDDGDAIAGQYGIAPQLSTLEQMAYPKNESILGSIALGKMKGYSFTERANPPIIIFIWGKQRLLPVNITSLNITEQEFNTELNPVRATVSVSLTVIEGLSGIYRNTMLTKEVMAGLNTSAIDPTKVIIPS